MKKIYGTYRHKWTNTGVRYTPSYYLDKQYKDYLDAWLTKTLDNEIPENRYIAEIVPWIKKQTRFIIWEYNEQYIDPIAFKENIKKVWAEFAIWMFDTPLEACKWIEENTDLKKLQDIKDNNWNVIWAEYEMYPEKNDEITGKTVPSKTLLID